MTAATRVIRPVAFAPSHLISTNAVNPNPVWTAGSYAIGAMVTYSIDNGTGIVLPHQFESLVASNTAVPGSDAAKWLDVGLANTVAMFECVNVSRRTSRAGGLSVLIKPGAYVDSIGMYGLSGDLLTLEVLESDGITVLIAQTESLSGRSITSMLEYLWEPRTQIERANFDGLAAFPGRYIRITITGAEAAIGAVCYGTMVALGLSPNYGASWELTDFLGVERDEFGNLKRLFPQAPYADTESLTVMVPTGIIKKVKSVLTSLRQTPTVWIGDGGANEYRTVLNVLGVFDSVSIAIEYPTYSVLDVRVIGVSAT